MDSSGDRDCDSVLYRRRLRPVFAVFTGTRLTSLRKVGYPEQRVTFETKPGQVFQIQAMAPTSTPAFDMHLELIPRPQNDNYTNRFHLTGILVSTNGSTQAATREVGSGGTTPRPELAGPKVRSIPARAIGPVHGVPINL